MSMQSDSENKFLIEIDALMQKNQRYKAMTTENQREAERITDRLLKCWDDIPEGQITEIITAALDAAEKRGREKAAAPKRRKMITNIDTLAEQLAVLPVQYKMELIRIGCIFNKILVSKCPDIKARSYLAFLNRTIMFTAKLAKGNNLTVPPNIIDIEYNVLAHIVNTSKRCTSEREVLRGCTDATASLFDTDCHRISYAFPVMYTQAEWRDKWRMLVLLNRVLDNSSRGGR